MSILKRLIGSSPSQVSRNKDLGKLAFVETALVPVPPLATSTGTQGQLAQDGSYLYVCTATNTWKRVAIATW